MCYISSNRLMNSSSFSYVSQNELPWQYRMDRLPSLLFFPAGRRSSSALFPRNIPFSVSSVIAFVLSQCQRDLRLRIALTSCSMHCIRRNVADLRHRQNRIRRQLAVVRKVSAEYNFQVITFEKMIIMYGNELRLTQATIELLYSLQVLSKEMIKQETLWLVELYIRLRAFLLSLHPTSFV
ncbi:hypothetical protein AB6A40_010361 [Gnathostoma spinigerum]|uniref:Uncharacterized protein n=1 Tax=Gnathostoma spinigerum TaxID=75299 RepID=A0ABD6EX07_9BILA